MRLLLDSHTALWILLDDHRLGDRARHRILDAERVYFSVVTPWELGIERASGKLSYTVDLSTELAEAGFEVLAIGAEHARVAPDLPTCHHDPFDRMLIAQAQVERLTVVTADAVFGEYEVQTLDARS